MQGDFIVGRTADPDFAGGQLDVGMLTIGKAQTHKEAIRGIVRNNIVRDTASADISLYAVRDAIIANAPELLACAAFVRGRGGRVASARRNTDFSTSTGAAAARSQTPQFREQSRRTRGRSLLEPEIEMPDLN